MLFVIAENAKDMQQEVFVLDPLGQMPDVEHLLPTTSTPQTLPVNPRKLEDGSCPLTNRRREAFCCILTGWSGEGVRVSNYEAYMRVYGCSGAAARVASSRLLAEPEVKARVAYLEKAVEAAKRHDYLAAQRAIDEFRLGVVERAKNNSKLAPVALQAARDFEAAHGLTGGKAAGSVETSVAAITVSSSDGLGTIRAMLAHVRATKKESEQ